MKKLLLFLITIVFISNVNAQRGFDGNVVKGEIGISAGVAHYFGDLNTRANINRFKPAVGIYYRKQFNNYLGARISAHFAQLGYSDAYSKNQYQQQRNLSFNSDIIEFALHGDFNFFKYMPGDPKYNFTPYVTIGLGVFSYNPYAYLNDKKVFLRPLGTEGQNNPAFLDPNGKKRTPYGSIALCIPIGLGIKYNINDRINFSFQIAQRLTTTDYLDDVSSTYAGIDNFPRLQPSGDFSIAAIMQDRSYEKGLQIGKEGTQRGWSKQKDQYIIAEIGISFNISSYTCPTDF
jgi:hypothetical protein